MVSEKKKKLVQELTRLIQTYPVVALVNMQNLPAKQLQDMRTQLLKKNILITMTRKKLLRMALNNSQKQNIEQLTGKIKGMPALLLAKENPFTLYATLQKNKSSAPAKPNQTAPNDIVIPAGSTNFAPGPIISELASVGIKTKVEGGKLVIAQDTTVAKKDSIISLKLAEVLKRLDVRPMEIGLNLVAVWENNLVFDAQQLHIDEAAYLGNIILAFQETFNLAMEIAYPSTETVELLLQKAFRESRGLALEQNILTDLTAEEILAKTEREALLLKETANIVVPEKKIEVLRDKVSGTPEASPPSEKPAEEKKEEPEMLEMPKAAEEKEKEFKAEEKPAERVEEEKKKEPEQIIEEQAPKSGIKEEKELGVLRDKVSGTIGSKASEETKKEDEKKDEEKGEEEKKKEEEKKDEEIPSVEEMVQAARKAFDPNFVKEPPKPSAEQLVAEEERERPKKDMNVKEAESLFEKLKMKGTLRKS